MSDYGSQAFVLLQAVMPVNICMIFLFGVFCCRISQSFGDVAITGEGLEFLPLSSVGSLMCHTYCDSGHPCIMVIFKDT